MAGGQAVVVASGDVRNGFYITFGTYDDGFPLGYGDAIPGVEYPRSAYVDALGEFVVQAEADVMPPVVLVGKPFALADVSVFEAVVGFG